MKDENGKTPPCWPNCGSRLGLELSLGSIPARDSQSQTTHYLTLFVVNCPLSIINYHARSTAAGDTVAPGLEFEMSALRRGGDVQWQIRDARNLCCLSIEIRTRSWVLPGFHLHQLRPDCWPVDGNLCPAALRRGFFDQGAEMADDDGIVVSNLVLSLCPRFVVGDGLPLGHVNL